MDMIFSTICFSHRLNSLVSAPDYAIRQRYNAYTRYAARGQTSMLTGPNPSDRAGAYVALLRPSASLRLLLAGVLAAAGMGWAAALVHAWLLTSNPAVRGALLGGTMAAGATALGTLPILFSQKFSQRTYDSFLGLGAGIMLAATAFSLVQPAISASRALGAGQLQASLVVAAGMLGGMGFVMGLSHATQSWQGLDTGTAQRDAAMRRAWLFVAAVTIHNLPEGLAIGVSFASPDLAKAQGLATGISIQDIPEGLVVALALRTVGYGRVVSVLLGVLSGVVEPVAAVLGVVLIHVAAGALPWGLALAAGAMLYVLLHDVLPEAHSHGNGHVASCAGVAGFIVMMVLDTALG